MFLKKLKKHSLPKNVVEALENFVKKVKGKYEDAEIYLFGSYARGTWTEDSDIDLIVVSKHFAKMSAEERVRLLRKMASRKTPFQILAYTPDEFCEAKRKSIALQDAEEYWIKLA